MTAIHGFELIREQYIPEISTKAKLFRHIRTGAELLSLENDDENKSFGIAFKTPADDNTGLPHILEHSVLGGSRKYRTKEPFVTLLKTSVNTFLNAMTFPDMTIYPVASINLKDFWNLVDVYLDAVFYPTITEKTLQQEGWHYEIESPDAPLIYKGVVFNEMKGAYSTPEGVLETFSLRELLPDTPYANDVGGDPAAIPNLTYAKFKAFHETFYHPSNARIFFYGDDDPTERLRRIDEFIADFNAHPIDATLPLQPRFSTPRKVVKPYDAGEADGDSNKGFIKVSWLLPEVTDAERLLELEILSHILVETPASPLRKALIDSGLGEDLTAAGVDYFKREASFSVGMKGILPSDADNVELLVLETLGELAEDGIDKATVEASLNTVEFVLREKNTGQFPRGLAAFIQILPAWLHGGDPMAHLAFEQALNAIKLRFAEQPAYFESLIGEYFLNNSHRSTVILEPNPQVKVDREEAEAARLRDARATMNGDDIQRVIADAEELNRIQTTPDAPEAVASIPTLRLGDLDRQVKFVPIEVTQSQGSTIVYHDLQTSGVAYVDFGFNLYSLPAKYLPYIELFGRSLTEIGTKTEDYVALTQRIGAKTGGIYAEVFTSVKIGTSDSVAYLFMRGKSMMAHTGDMLDILKDILLTVELDNQDRFLQMVLEEKANQEAMVTMGGHQVVSNRIRAGYDDAGYANEQIHGLSNLFFVRELAERVENDWQSVLADLQAMQRLLINRNALVINATMNADDWAKFQPQLNKFLSALPAAEVKLQKWERRTIPEQEALTVPVQVNYVGKGANLYSLGYRLHGSQVVILKHMNFDYLWTKIRVQGGAYGGRALFNPMSGVLTYLSWRDPNLAGTLANYDGAAEYLRSMTLSDDDLEKAIIGAIGELDRHLLPDAKGYFSTQRYLIGYTDDMRQKNRDEVFATTLKDFKNLGDMLVKLNEVGRVSVVTSTDDASQANTELSKKLTITPVL